MPDEIITMQDMGVIFSVTDPMGIHRESVSVELTKEDPGSIGRSSSGVVEITVASMFQAWRPARNSESATQKPK